MAVCPDFPKGRDLPDEYKKTLRKYSSTLEMIVWNKTREATLTFEEEYFNSGMWFEHFYPSVVQPRTLSSAFVVSKPGSLFGVSGGMKFVVKDNDKTRYLIIGYKSVLGKYKIFITLKRDENCAPKDAYDETKEDKPIRKNVGDYTVDASITTPYSGGKKAMLFIIEDL